MEESELRKKTDELLKLAGAKDFLSVFLNYVCLRQMMTASPNDVRYANDVCLRAHRGKHRIIAKRSGATSYLRSKCIISPQGDASFKTQAYALIYLRKCDIINSPINKNLTKEIS